MNINLKKLSLEKEAAKYVHKRLSEQVTTRPLASKLNNIIKLLDEIELDLELGGECIIELNKDRLESIAERDKTLRMLREGDDEI
jgi:hypothetical protein